MYDDQPDESSMSQSGMREADSMIGSTGDMESERQYVIIDSLADFDPTVFRAPYKAFDTTNIKPNRVISRFLIQLIDYYQRRWSNALGTVCGYPLSCSQFTQAAIAKHGPVKGLVLGIRRILHCRPPYDGLQEP